jgi:pyruvate formate lyase activating enzyme
MRQGRGTYIPPEQWAEQGIRALTSPEGKRMGADRLFFTGGEPTCSLPWVEAVAECCTAPIHFDTNGFMTPSSLERVLSFSDSLTFDIKAVTPGIHRLLTGAPVEPVIRNCTYIIEHALEKVYEFRMVVYPNLVEEAQNVASFLADLSEDAPLCYLAFRPNFVLERIRGITTQEMKEAVSFARSAGLKHVAWAGLPNISGAEPGEKAYERLARLAGCQYPHEKRLCTCDQCALMEYIPFRRT